MTSKDITTGTKFGQWTVLEVGKTKSTCVCSCGSTYEVFNGNLLKGSNGGSTKCKSCAMKLVARNRKPRLVRKVLTHLPSKVYMKLCWIVGNCIAKCTDPNHPAWKNYGERGIRICSEWLQDTNKFLVYLASLPGHDNFKLVIDRIDNNGHYEPGNLRFTNRSVSSYNRRKFSHKLEHDHDGRFKKKYIGGGFCS